MTWQDWGRLIDMGYEEPRMGEGLKYTENFKRIPYLQWLYDNKNKNKKENNMYYAVKFRGTDKEYFYRTEKPLNIGTEYEIECGDTHYSNPITVVRQLTTREAKAKENYLKAPLRLITSYKIVKAPARPNDRIKKVIFNREKRTTCVLWDDGKKTVVKCAEEDLWDEEKALALCYMKRVLGNRGSFNETLKKWCWRG